MAEPCGTARRNRTWNHPTISVGILVVPKRQAPLLGETVEKAAAAQLGQPFRAAAARLVRRVP